jgi:integrase
MAVANINSSKGIDEHFGSYRIRFKHKGKRYTETHPGDLSKTHLRSAIQRREWLIARLKVGLPIEQTDATQLSEIAEDYFESLDDLKFSTTDNYRRLWHQRWRPAFGTLTAEHITTQMIRKQLSTWDVAQKTKKNCLSVLSSVLDFADCTPNPCAPIKFRRKQKTEIDRYLPAEWNRLESRLSGENLLYFSIMRATGMRPGEVLALEWSDYDGEKLSVSKQVVRCQLVDSTKKSVRRSVAVEHWLRPMLDNCPIRFAGGPILVNTIGTRHCDSNDFNIAWRKAHTRARVPYRIPYRLRHTRAAELLSRGCAIPLAAKQLGHSPAMFLNTYSEFIEEYSTENMDNSTGPCPSLAPGKPKKP